MTLCSSCACKQSDGWCRGWHQFTSRDVHCPYYKRKCVMVTDYRLVKND